MPFTEVIPGDYEGIMGVPISFMDKYCPEQFEILGYEREDENVKCRATSTIGCSYQLSGSGDNGPYDVVMNEDCPDGQYCFGKWDSAGNLLTGWVGDKDDKYIYGVCINMSHSIDSPAKDMLNPWKKVSN